MTSLDDSAGRVLELPGIDFASYRWGHTLDPVSVGLTSHSVLAREQVPMGGEAGISLLSALDRSLQEGWFEPRMLEPVARLFGSGALLVRNDLEYERYHTVRPPVMWQAVRDALMLDGSGLSPPREYGGHEPNRAVAARPMIDEVELALDPDADPPPQVAVIPIADGQRERLTARATGGGVVVDGDGEGVLTAAAAGLLDTRSGPVLLAADLTRADGRFDDTTGPATRYVITDSNRKRAQRWYALRENTGGTEPQEHRLVDDDPSDARLEVVDDALPTAKTVVEWRGVEQVGASAYGSPFTLAPEVRPANAFDGDPRTAWLVETAFRPPYEITVDVGREVDAEEVVLVPPRRRPGWIPVPRLRITLDDRRPIDVELSAEELSRPEGVPVRLDGEPFSRFTLELLPEPGLDGPVGFAEIAIPGVQVEEVVHVPTDLTDALGARVAEVPLAIVLTRLRASPSEPVRADPEPALARSFELPAALTATLSGTARMSARAPDAMIDALAGVRGAVYTSSEHLPGARRSRAAAAFDGDSETAWQTPLAGVVGQWLSVRTPQPLQLRELDMDVVTDQRHSLPTRVEVSVDGNPPLTVDLPDLTAQSSPGAVRRVRVPLPRELRGREVRLTIEGIEPRTSPDWFTTDPVVLPVGIAEVRIPGVPPAMPAERTDTGCRADLLTLDGSPVPVRVTGGVQDALDGDGLALQQCGPPLSLAAGGHELRTVPGADTGIDLDRVVLRTPIWDLPSPELAPAPRVEVTSVGVTHAAGRVQTDGSPFWLVLDQSVNDGWELEVDGASVDGPRPIDSFAAGWLVEPERAGELAVSVRWTPQRVANIALAVSAVAVIACIVLCIGRPRRRRDPDATLPRQPEAPRLAVGEPARSRRTVPLAAAGGAFVAALTVHPVAALPVALALGIGLRRPMIGRFLPPALVGAAGVIVAGLQLGHEYELDGTWPSKFGIAHILALTGAVLLALHAVTEGRPRRRRE
jgi:arabinofuranan 3-O-arabinosyltransferase